MKLYFQIKFFCYLFQEIQFSFGKLNLKFENFSQDLINLHPRISLAIHLLIHTSSKFSRLQIMKGNLSFSFTADFGAVKLNSSFCSNFNQVTWFT